MLIHKEFVNTYKLFHVNELLTAVHAILDKPAAFISYTSGAPNGLFR